AADRPNQKWVEGFTYIWTAEGWLYVAAVIDLFLRRVVGWSMSATMTAQLVTDALILAIWRCGKPDALLHHSDRGSQYTSEQFQRTKKNNGVTCSMSRSGNCWDNTAMESFFHPSKPSGSGVRSTDRETKPEPICSIISRDFIIRHADTRPWGISDPSTSSGKLV
ncbi:integrase, partial [Sphingobium cupriresistens LL01]